MIERQRPGRLSHLSAAAALLAAVGSVFPSPQDCSTHNVMEASRAVREAQTAIDRAAKAGALWLNAQEALERLDHRPVDVIISDIGMAGQDGYDFLRQLRESGNRTPALALTAFARGEDRLRALHAGYQMHLAKPVEAAELIASVASLAGRIGPAA